jgi:hypothetical protein
MAEKSECRRCGAPTPTYLYEADSSFWGLVVYDIKTTVERRARVAGTYFRHNPDYRSGDKSGSPLIRSDEEMPLCSECWSLLVGRFMQGRDVTGLDKPAPGPNDNG